MCMSCDYVTSPKGKGRGNKKVFIFAKICDKRGRVLSIGWNSYVKTHPIQLKYAKKNKMPLREFLHAEAMAIIRLLPQHRAKAYSITVYRFRADGTPALAKPCPICMSMIRATGTIKKVYYTTDNDPLDFTFDEYCEAMEDAESWT